MEFSEFFGIIHPILDGKSNTSSSAKTLFDALLNKNGQELLNNYKPATFKAYANGHTKITKIAKTILPCIDPQEFEEYIEQFDDPATNRLCESFKPYIPGINKGNVVREVTDFFIKIIETAANTKRRTPSSKKKEKKNNTLDEGTSNNGDIKNKTENALDIKMLSQEDKDTLKVFRGDSAETLLYIINNDPFAGPTKTELSEEVSFIIQKWQLRYKKIENSSLRNIVAGIIKTLGEYSYYLSDIFLHPIPERNILWFRNESSEEGNRLREEFQPNTFNLRCKIAELYNKLYPIPESE